jgi:hypothetical protein
MHRIDHGLKHRQAAGRQLNASPDHDTVVSLSRERPLYLGSGYFIGLNQAQVRAPSAFGHMIQGQGNAGMDFLGVRARRKHWVSEIHGLWLLPYEQNMRHLIILRVCATSRALLLRGTYTAHWRHSLPKRRSTRRLRETQDFCAPLLPPEIIALSLRKNQAHT